MFKVEELTEILLERVRLKLDREICQSLFATELFWKQLELSQQEKSWLKRLIQKPRLYAEEISRLVAILRKSCKLRSDSKILLIYWELTLWFLSRFSHFLEERKSTSIFRIWDKMMTVLIIRKNSAEIQTTITMLMRNSSKRPKITLLNCLLDWDVTKIITFWTMLTLFVLLAILWKVLLCTNLKMETGLCSWTLPTVLTFWISSSMNLKFLEFSKNTLNLWLSHWNVTRKQSLSLMM